MAICNKDCFHCQFPDCIRDEQQDNRDNYNKYRSENLEKERERDRKRYASNKNRKLKSNQEWLERNKEHRREYMREYMRNKKEMSKQI